MKLSRLLDRFRTEKDLSVEERTNSDGVQQYIVWTTLPFPKIKHSAWYVFTLPLGVTSDEHNIEQWHIDACLRHLWMFQLDIRDEDAPLTEEESEAESAEIGMNQVDEEDS